MGVQISLLLVSRDLGGKEVHERCLADEIVYMHTSRNTISYPFFGSKHEAVTYDGVFQAEGCPW